MNRIEIPLYQYFAEKNIFTGSYGAIQCKIIPKETLKVLIWKGPYCCDKSEILTEQEFELNESGYEESKKWLAKQVEALL